MVLHWFGGTPSLIDHDRVFVFYAAFDRLVSFGCGRDCHRSLAAADDHDDDDDDGDDFVVGKQCIYI